MVGLIGIGLVRVVGEVGAIVVVAAVCRRIIKNLPEGSCIFNC